MPHSTGNKKPCFRNPRTLLLFGVSACLSALLVYVLWQAHPNTAYWQDLWEQSRSFLEDHTWVLVLAVATLPGLGAPISPLLVLLGAIIGPRYGLPTACAIGIAAHSICSVWTYAVAAGPLRRFLLKTLLKNRTLPNPNRRNALHIAIVVRITPFLPYALQNIMLGVLQIPFRLYLITSIPLQSLYTIGFVVTGGAIFKGRTGLALTALLLILVLVLVTRMLRNRTLKNA
ncbi:MAG: hypothetical protein ACLFUF_08105 [Opitutales bacterium]